MSITEGSIVRATAGRDKDSFFVVVGLESNFAFIADGKRRKVDAPKKKKLIHLAETKTVVKGSYETNPQIKRILSQFKNGG